MRITCDNDIVEKPVVVVSTFLPKFLSRQNTAVQTVRNDG